MISASVEQRGFKIVAKRFEDFAARSVKVGAKTIYDVVWKWRNIIATYPPPYAGDPPFQWASEAQRKYVMWALKQKLIQIPYQRTGAYGWNWRVQRDQSINANEGIGYRLYNTAVPYAKHVAGGPEGDPEQFYLHQGRWTEFQDALANLREALPATIESNIRAEARRAGLNGLT